MLVQVELEKTQFELQAKRGEGQPHVGAILPCLSLSHPRGVLVPAPCHCALPPCACRRVRGAGWRAEGDQVLAGRAAGGWVGYLSNGASRPLLVVVLISQTGSVHL